MGKIAISDCISVYQFAIQKGVRPQYLYQKLSNNKIPRNILGKRRSESGEEQLFFIKDRAEKWWEEVLKAREERAVAAAENRVTKAKPVQLASDPKQLLAMTIGFFKQAGNEKLATSLQEVLNKMTEDDEND